MALATDVLANDKAQHYFGHKILDPFSMMGRTRIHVTWELRVTDAGHGKGIHETASGQTQLKKC